MKPMMSITLAAGMSMVMVMSAGAFALGQVGAVLGRYPTAAHVIKENVSVRLIEQGFISEDSVYETTNALEVVQAYYEALYHIEPEVNIVNQGACVRLAKVNGYVLARQTVAIVLCPLPQGTQVYFNQELYLGQ